MKEPRRWTEEEDSLLLNAIALYEGQITDWVYVDSHVEGRTNKDCRKRWVYLLEPNINNGPWQESESALLVEAVQIHGTDLTSHTKIILKECCRRWNEVLKPNINRGRWSLYEVGEPDSCFLTLLLPVCNTSEQ
ncbi:putative Myb-like protein A [Leptodontidium sp. MPI-SDFR-AT-0119]|nr:putative Myb-like protein A [Leptodontidium sp. MPI-SDFR-AT-0119]